MKKLTKLFLLALCSWFLFLWFSFALDGWTNPDSSNALPYETEWRCTALCGVSLLGFFSKRFLIFLWVILWILLLALTINATTLHKKFKNTPKDICLAYVPVLNLYSISKITIWKGRFFYLILLVWFFCYSVYRNINDNRCCYHEPSRIDYAWIIIWISAIIILWELLSWLSKFNKQDSNKESSDRIE